MTKARDTSGKGKHIIARSRSPEDAVKDRIKHSILKSYLQRKSSEVIDMLIAEYDYDMDISVQREEAGKEAENHVKLLPLCRNACSCVH